MATIYKRVTNKGTKYQVQVRKKGHQPVFKSFLTLKDARTYGKETEGKIERSVFQCAKDSESLLFGELAKRYLDEILVFKKGYNTEKYNIRPLLSSTAIAIRPPGAGKVCKKKTKLQKKSAGS